LKDKSKHTLQNLNHEAVTPTAWATSIYIYNSIDAGHSTLQKPPANDTKVKGERDIAVSQADHWTKTGPSGTVSIV
jgi:hypothetical protein